MIVEYFAELDKVAFFCRCFVMKNKCYRRRKRGNHQNRWREYQLYLVRHCNSPEVKKCQRYCITSVIRRTNLQNELEGN